MADDKRELEGSSTGGNEWEVVSVTASGPGAVESAEEKKDKHLLRSDPEPAIALFMSDHFVFPPCEHENLPLDLESHDVAESGSQQGYSTVDDAGYGSKEPSNVKNLSGPDELSGIEYFGKGKQIWVAGVDHEERKEFDGQKLAETVASCYSATYFNEAMHSESDDIVEHGHQFSENLDPSSEILQSDKSSKEDRYSASPYESWWRRHALSLYAHAKEANKFWSVFVAAAIMGLVILGQRWQQERWQIEQLKWNLSNHDKIVHRVLAPMSRFKDVLIGTHRPGLGGISAIGG